MWRQAAILCIISGLLGTWVNANGFMQTIRMALYPIALSFDGKKELQAGETSTFTAGKEEGIYGVSLGKSSNDVIALLGDPQRKDPSTLGYEWWIYNGEMSSYIQVGIKNGIVVDLYSNAPTWSYQGVKAGTSKSDLQQRFPIEPYVSFTYQNAHFKLTNQTNSRPLVLHQGQPVIFYLDQHNEGRVTAIRLISKEGLVKNRSYTMEWTFSGAKPDVQPPSLSSAQQHAVDRANERQIFDLTNVVRLRFGIGPLSWNEEAAKVARSHSLDMLKNQFFGHVSPTNGLDPFERLSQAGVTYRTAGENIAGHYSDGIETHEAWMNSKGHRVTILTKDFTTLGVGVTKNYYTQNFVTPR